MMDEEWEELERNGAEEVLTSSRFIETQKTWTKKLFGSLLNSLHLKRSHNRRMTVEKAEARQPM